MERIIKPVFWTNRAIKDLEKVTRFNIKLFGFNKSIEIATEIQEATERLIDFCSSWNELSGAWEQRYSLEFYAAHLAESKKSGHKETLMALPNNLIYLKTQYKVLKHFKGGKNLLDFTDMLDLFIKEKINEKYLDSYTLNSLASEAGFSNLTTFITAFKKIENCTPSEYLLKLKV